MSNIYLFIINSKKSGSVRHTNHIWTMTVYTDNNWEQKKTELKQVCMFVKLVNRIIFDRKT